LKQALKEIQTDVLRSKDGKFQLLCFDSCVMNTFEIAIEMLERERWVVHESTADTVDTLLRGRQPSLQVRTVNETGEVKITRELPVNPMPSHQPQSSPSWKPNGWRASGQMAPVSTSKAEVLPEKQSFEQLLDASFQQTDAFKRDFSFAEDEFMAGPNGEDLPLHIYPYGISRHQLDQVIQVLKLPIVLTKDLDGADAVLALRSHVKNHSKLRQISKARHIPIHTIKASTVGEITHGLQRMLHIDDREIMDIPDLRLFTKKGSDDEIEALEEARLAVGQIVIPKGQPVELLPRSATVRKMQHELVEHYRLRSSSFGDEPNRRLRIYPA